MIKKDIDVRKIHQIFKGLRESTETDELKAISQRKLANETGISYSRISYLENENDDTMPSLNDLIAYRNFFGVSIDYLLGLEEEPSTNSQLRAISNEYGITSKALENIKESLLIKRFGKFDDDFKEALNMTLESKKLKDLLLELSIFYKFYPYTDRYSELTFHDMNNVIDSTVEENRINEIYNEYPFPSEIQLESTFYEKILLENVKEIISDIKEISPKYINTTKEEINRLNSIIDFYKNSKVKFTEQSLENRYKYLYDDLEKLNKRLELSKTKK